MKFSKLILMIIFSSSVNAFADDCDFLKKAIDESTAGFPTMKGAVDFPGGRIGSDYIPADYFAPSMLGVKCNIQPDEEHLEYYCRVKEDVYSDVLKTVKSCIKPSYESPSKKRTLYSGRTITNTVFNTLSSSKKLVRIEVKLIENSTNKKIVTELDVSPVVNEVTD